MLHRLTIAVLCFLLLTSGLFAEDEVVIEQAVRVNSIADTNVWIEQGYDVVLSAELTGQAHDIVWTVEMAGKVTLLDELATEYKALVIELKQLFEVEQVVELGPGNAPKSGVIELQTQAYGDTWIYIVKIREGGKEQSREGFLTEEMLAKLQELQDSYNGRTEVLAELVQIYDEAGIAHYNPYAEMYSRIIQRHAGHDCNERPCKIWQMGQWCQNWFDKSQFPPQRLIEVYEIPNP